MKHSLERVQGARGGSGRRRRAPRRADGPGAADRPPLEYIVGRRGGLCVVISVLTITGSVLPPSDSTNPQDKTEEASRGAATGTAAAPAGTTVF